MKRRHTPTDGLDLLLDAVTNTFGGVLFVAVLVTILIRARGPSEQRSRVSPTNDQLETLTAIRESELETLKAAWRQQERNIDVLAGELTGAAVADILELQRRRDELLAENREASQRVLEARKSMAAIVTQSEDAARLANQIERERDRLRELANRTEEASRNAQVPTLRKSTKLEFPLILRYGRVYAPYEPDALTARGGRTLDDFFLLGNDADFVKSTPKPYRGIDLRDPRHVVAIASLLNRLDRRRVHVSIAVWDDSFREFGSLRDALVESDFEYRLMPVVSGTAVIEGDPGTPLVQ